LHGGVNEASNLTRCDNVAQVFPDVLENWISFSLGVALKQKTHLDCLTLKMKAVQAALHQSTSPSSLSLLITPIPSLSQTMASTKANDESLRRATDSDFETYASSAALGTKPTTLPTDQW